MSDNNITMSLPKASWERILKGILVQTIKELNTR